MFKKIFFHGLAAAALAAAAAIIYWRIYFFALGTNFSKLVNVGVLISINFAACLVAALCFWIFKRWFKSRAEIIFNLSFTILSFASIIIPISISLPLDIQNPELFPGLTVPMHFFPALAWFTLNPLFRHSN